MALTQPFTGVSIWDFPRFFQQHERDCQQDDMEYRAEQIQICASNFGKFSARIGERRIWDEYRGKESDPDTALNDCCNSASSRLLGWRPDEP